MDILNKILELFISPRFISFYWRTGSMATVGFLNLISEGITDVGLPAYAVVVIGLILSEATKAISNLKQGKPLGFSRIK